MFKLYHGRFTAKQLRALASHCYSFCPKGSEFKWCKWRECEYWGVCVALDRLADYALTLADEQEVTSPKN